MPATRRRFTARLFAWHATSERRLVVRSASTPWEVLVAEVMSHQTGIERVGPFWRRFVAAWPSPEELAAAGTRDLLAAWAGLGYNRRALALREAARLIVRDHRGEVPSTVEELDALPGIGPYTARAVAATAFRVPVAPLDVNVLRVVCRVTGREPRARDLQAVADALVSRGEPRRWLEAVMDLAATVCRRRSPRCEACPLRPICATRGVAEWEGGAAGPDSTPFPRSNRWLRGRLVAAAAGLPAGRWLELPEELGDHDRAAIVWAAEELAADGFLELRGPRFRARA